MKWIKKAVAAFFLPTTWLCLKCLDYDITWNELFSDLKRRD